MNVLKSAATSDDDAVVDAVDVAAVVLDVVLSAEVDEVSVAAADTRALKTADSRSPPGGGPDGEPAGGDCDADVVVPVPDVVLVNAEIGMDNPEPDNDVMLIENAPHDVARSCAIDAPSFQAIFRPLSVKLGHRYGKCRLKAVKNAR